MHVFFCVSKNVSVSCAYTQGKREQFSGFNRTLDAINNVFRKFSAFHDETGRLNVDGMNIISNDGSNKLNRSRKARVCYKVQRTINASLILFQELDAVIHQLMKAKHWGLRKSRNATSLNSRFKSLDTLKDKIISVTFRKVIRTNHKKASKNWRHEIIQLGGCQS